MGTRKKYDPETKLAVVLEGLKGETSIAELCRKYQISEALYYRWRDKFLEGGKKALATTKDSYTKALEKRIEELEKIIGRQTIQIEILKKISQTTA